jgi:hypothetical protein
MKQPMLDIKEFHLGISISHLLCAYNEGFKRIKFATANNNYGVKKSGDISGESRFCLFY